MPPGPCPQTSGGVRLLRHRPLEGQRAGLAPRHLTATSGPKSMITAALRPCRLCAAGRRSPGLADRVPGRLLQDAEPWLGTPHQRSLSATRATAPASHYHLDRTRPWAHTATVGAAVPRMAEFREIKLRPLDANSIERGLQSSTRDSRFPVPGSAPAATGHVPSEHLAITGRRHQR